jgi:regulator of protease activity HflC (stomatin/prohibitin superfamily)
MVGIGVAAVIGLATVFGSYYTIDPTEVGVVTRWGEIIYDKQGPGLHFKVPFADSVHKIPVAIQEIKVSSDDRRPINTYTVDNQEVDVSFNIFYRIPADKAAYVYANIPDYDQRLTVMAIDRTKSVMGDINIQQLAEKRGEVRDRIKNLLVHDAATLGLLVTDFNLTDLQYDKGFRQAVAQAAVQKANVESRIYELQQAEKEALKKKAVAEGEANAVRERAKGDADARLLNATAEAKSTQLIGLAQAAAIKAKSDALKSSPELVEYTKADRWDGKLPSAIYAGAPIPFLNAPTK